VFDIVGIMLRHPEYQWQEKVYNWKQGARIPIFIIMFLLY